MARTTGEQVFEEYLISQGLTDFEYEKGHEGKSKKPDYTLKICSREYLFDVKEFEYQPVLKSGAYDPYPRIREKINRASRQFKEFKAWPCCLVLYNPNAPLVDLATPEIMLGVMYGNYGITLDFNAEKTGLDPSTARWRFGEKGKMFRPNSSEPQNTTINAIVTLRYVDVGMNRFMKFMDDLSKSQKIELADYLTAQVDFDKHEKQLGVVVWENVFARIPLPRDLFCGPYDERYGAAGDFIARIFAGAGVLECEELDKRSSSIIPD